MIGYNLYYDNIKINSRELTEEELKNVMSKGNITKIDKITNKKTIIPTCKITCVKCTIV